MTILITGVAGFIGSHLAKYYLDSGEVVVGVDNFSSYYSTELKRRRVFNLSDPNFKFYELDLSVLNNSSRLFKEFNFNKVFHFAAQPGVRLPIKDNHIYTKDNLVAFSNVMQSIIDFEVKEFNKSHDRFLIIDEFEVYHLGASLKDFGKKRNFHIVKVPKYCNQLAIMELPNFVMK